MRGGVPVLHSPPSLVLVFLRHPFAPFALLLLFILTLYPPLSLSLSLSIPSPLSPPPSPSSSLSIQGFCQDCGGTKQVAVDIVGKQSGTIKDVFDAVAHNDIRHLKALVGGQFGLNSTKFPIATFIWKRRKVEDGERMR